MLVKFNPFNSVVTHDIFSDEFFPTISRGFEPSIDVTENAKEFLITAELPGLEKDDFKLTVANNLLTLEGEKKFEHKEEEDGYSRSERSFGAFKRTFRLTDSVNINKIKADYNQGVLMITIPKAEKAKPKAIEISVK